MPKDDIPGFDRGELDIPHYVSPEIRFLREGQVLTPRERSQGWRETSTSQRKAIVRMICMDCVNSNYIRRQLNAEQRSKAIALERDQAKEANFYLQLADVDGAY